MDLHTYWYLGLVFLSLLQLIYVYFKKRSNRIFLVFFSMVGLGYLVESIIYCFLHSYQYFPHIVRNPVYDSIFGAFASNLFALPVSATFISTLHKRKIWFFLFIGLFSLVEWLFLQLHIYKHNWWRTYYTSGGLFFYYGLSKIFFKKMEGPINGLWHFILTFLISSTFMATFHFLAIILFSSRTYQLGWYSNIYQDTNAFAAIYYLFVSLTIVFIAKVEFHWKIILAPLVVFLADAILRWYGILHSMVWWDTYYNLVLAIITLLITEKVGKHLAFGRPRLNFT